MDKIARIDMGAPGGPAVTVEDVGEYVGLGGRALTSLLVAKEVHPLCHPLGAENKLVIAPGMLSGTTGSMTGRLSVGCKSPLTGTIKESNAAYVDGSAVTLVDMDFSKILADDANFQKLVSAQTQSITEIQRLVKSMPGVRLDTQDQITIKFQ